MSSISSVRRIRPCRSRRLGLTASSALSGSARALFGFVSVLGYAGLAQAQALPTNGVVTRGQATISGNASSVSINQATQNAAINWQSFNIAQGNAVQFVQPNSSSVALNRVVGTNASAIFGTLTANGQVFLINPNGVLFGRTAQVDVGGLVASTLDISDADFMAGRYVFTGSSRGAVLNEGTIKADSGYVALLGATVSNEGLIQANLGTVALAAGTAITLDMAGDGLLNAVVDQGVVDALVSNGGVVRANGGQVLMTAQAAGQLLKTVVNNTGVIEARTLGSRNGRIMLLGDMHSGAVDVAGTLDASAPSGGNGGFIETSAANVRIADSVRITTEAPLGTNGTWLVDPKDFIIGAGGDISGATLSAQLVTTNVTISTLASAGDGTSGNGDIFVNDAVAWTASGTPTTLTLNALRDVNINAAITATNGNLAVCCGRDVNVNAPVTTTNGSILLNAGQDVKVFFAITTTDGNIALCAGRDIHIQNAVTLTRGTTIPAQSLGLPVGLTLIAGSSGRGPGQSAGTLIFAPAAPPSTVTIAPVTINYNPVSYSAPTDFSTRFVLTEGATLTQRMLLFPNGSRTFDGTTSTVLTGFNTTATSGVPAGVTLFAGPNATATFDSSAVGADVGITFSGYSLTGDNANRYALASSCCVSTFRTTGTITAAPPPSPPPAPTPPPPPPPAPTPPPPAPTPTPPPPPAPTPPPAPPPAPPPPPPTPTPTPVPVPTPTPVPVPTPIPVPSAGGTRPLGGMVDDLWVPAVAAPLGLALVVVGSGVNVPAEQLALAQPVVAAQPQPEVLPQVPNREEEVREAAKPKVYPRKQARH